MKLVRVGSRGAERLLEQLEGRRAAASESVLPTVRQIVRGVRRGGDAALKRYAVKFDGMSPQSQLRISQDEMREGWEEASSSFKQALKVAATNIRAFAERQMPTEWNFSPLSGLTTGQAIRAVEAAGCYVPSGRYPLPSTLLMTVIPAQVAGVSRIVVVSPRPAPETLAAAWMLGVEHFYRIGGAQAIAAMAYGTESLPRVDKIVGPGNLYVTAAKKMVAFDCSIDMLAGPTEIVVTSEKGNAVAIASDLVAQAEHDPQALAIFVTTMDTLACKVMKEVSERVKTNAIARESLRRNGMVMLAPTVEVAREITNRLAPEHLTVDSVADLKWVRNAGSVFIGRHSAQPMGDYVSGPNHTLPTGTMARVRGGLSVLDFVRIMTVQKYTRQGLLKLGPAAITLAEAEGLKGHAEAIRARGARG